MADGKIEVDKKILQDIFSKDFWYVIPEYQRPYAWQSDNIADLIGDIHYAQNNGTNEYFVGSLVLKKTEEKDFSEYDVLDGQQRLTSFIILFACLRDRIKDEVYKDTLQSLIYQEANKPRKIPSRNKMQYQIRHNVEEFMNDHIITAGGTEKYDDLRSKKKKGDKSIYNMINAIFSAYENLNKIEDLEEFVDYLLNNVILIYVSTDNEEDAFRLFTILNDRGISLTSADIIKSTNIGALVNEKDQNEYARLWEEMENKIENRKSGDFDRFLGFIRTIFIKEKAQSVLRQEFDKKIYLKDGTGILKKGKEVMDVILEYDDIYDQIIELENKNLSNEFKNLVTNMKIGISSEEWIPPLLLYYKKFKMSKLTEFLKLLEYKFVGDLVCRESPDKRRKNIFEILREIEKTELNSIDDLLSNKLHFM
ncbi:DUF262 domain-containing protein [Methanococcus maripaludis]|uniref:Uncharacterized protein with ParB-like and HNH nuclease domain n=1 Tax=Methanococcus maripaludis TaxID=39152 RepID=A0A7J9PG86_METMI|nr:DUF262 domain-containing protein [Methanococcus maripaludis]MBA2861778.1 uncharacterized protein with ParB-like and HNH nuclease domain [Methanococcus maripaludis]